MDLGSSFHKSSGASLALTLTFSLSHLVEGTSRCCSGGNLDWTTACTADQLSAGHGTTGGLGGAWGGGDLNAC